MTDNPSPARGSSVAWVLAGLLLALACHTGFGSLGETAFAQGPETYTNSTTSHTSTATPPACSPVGSSTSVVAADVEITIGPGAIGIGPEKTLPFVVPAGTTNFNTNVHTEVTLCVPADGNLVGNGTFDSGLNLWQTFATPTLAYIVADVIGGVMNFHRVPPPAGTSNQAVAFQELGFPVTTHTGLTAEFDLANTDPVRKRISVLVLDSTFADLAVCTFWLAPNAPMRRYTIRTHSTQAWTNAAIYFYAATAGTSGGAYQLDNVSVRVDPASATDRTQCIDPLAPSAPGGAPGSDWLTNGTFTGTLAPWGIFGTIAHQLVNDVFEFKRPTATPPAGVVLQTTGQAVAANSILTATFELGNSSAVRKRVTVLVHDFTFADLHACTFWLPPGQPLLPYTYRSYVSQGFGNATISFYPATVGVEEWLRLDNVTLRRTPADTPLGTECLEPPRVTYPDAPGP